MAMPWHSHPINYRNISPIKIFVFVPATAVRLGAVAEVCLAPHSVDARHRNTCIFWVFWKPVCSGKLFSGNLIQISNQICFPELGVT